MFYVDGQLVEPTEEKPENNSKYGGKEYKFYCPSCSSKALSINDTSYLFRCWSCGIEGKAQTDNVIRIKEKIYEANSWRTEYDAQEKKKSNKPTKEITDKYIRLLIKATTINEFVRGYLASHNIPTSYARKYGIGYCDSTPEYPDKEIARTLGLINERGNTRLYRRILFPIRLGRRYIYVQGRKVGSDSKAKFLNMHGAAPFFNGSAIGEFDELYVCEGIPDCLAMIAAGRLNCIAMLGAQSFSDDLVKQLEGKKITFLLDGDKAGKAGAREAMKKLEGVAIEAKSISVPDGMDVSECIKNGEEILLDGGENTTRTNKEIKSSNEKRGTSRNEMEDKDDTKETSNRSPLAKGDAETQPDIKVDRREGSERSVR
jgi:DNA primase